MIQTYAVHIVSKIEAGIGEEIVSYSYQPVPTLQKINLLEYDIRKPE